MVLSTSDSAFVVIQSMGDSQWSTTGVSSGGANDF